MDKFYDTNLVRHENDQIDGTSTPRFEITFLNKYYFIGLKESVMKQSPYLYQNMNWEDYYGSEGTFDPLKLKQQIEIRKVEKNERKYKDRGTC